MKDASGNEMEKAIECSLQNQCYVQANKLDKATRMLTLACMNDHNTTKAEMRKAINEATKLILETRKWLVGGM